MFSLCHSNLSVLSSSFFLQDLPNNMAVLWDFFFFFKNKLWGSLILLFFCFFLLIYFYFYPLCFPFFFFFGLDIKFILIFSLYWKGIWCCENLAVMSFFKDFFWMWTIFKVLNLLQYCVCFSFWCFGWEVCRILASWPGMEPAPPALEGELLTLDCQESPQLLVFNCMYPLLGFGYSLSLSFSRNVCVFLLNFPLFKKIFYFFI